MKESYREFIIKVMDMYVSNYDCTSIWNDVTINPHKSEAQKFYTKSDILSCIDNFKGFENSISVIELTENKIDINSLKGGN